MEKGGYDLDFVEKVPEYLTCIICQLALKNTLLLIDCGHKVCLNCFEGLRRHAAERGTKPLCPNHPTNIDATKVVEDKGNDRVILALKVKCKHYSDGCQWIGELQKLEDHVQNKCSFVDKEKTLKLLKKFQGRLEMCEMQSQEKDKEIAMLKEYCKVSDERIISLEQQVQHCSKQLAERKQAAAMSEMTMNGGQFQNSTYTEYIQSKKQFAKFSKEIDSLQKNVSFIKMEHDGNVKKKIDTLQQHMGIIEQLISNKKTVIKWEVEDYYEHQLNGDVVVSPTFYSGVSGHCCKLKIKWTGTRKGRINILFHLCAGIYDTELYEDFSKKIKIEMVDREGYVVFSEITPDDIDGNPQDFVFTSGGESDGHAFKFDDFQYFLNMPRFREFIVHDSLFITCTMTSI